MVPLMENGKHSERSFIMFHTTHPHSLRAAALGVVLLTAVGSLTGCQTSAARDGVGEQGPRPAPQSTPMPSEYAGMPGDRIADALERESVRIREIADRFSGTPADRIEEQLARESGE